MEKNKEEKLTIQVDLINWREYFENKMKKRLKELGHIEQK